MLLSPINEDDDTPLLPFYVMPKLNLVNIRRGIRGGKEEKTLISLLRHVFYKDNKLCREIYLTADAGLGKTVLSKRLALAWCHAKKPVAAEKKHFSQEEIDTIAAFDFVFLLLLRESSIHCGIDDMIFNQIVSRCDALCSLKDIGKTLSKERCLVILDGLDEWTHPSTCCKQGLSSIPHRKVRECTILTTTRPWRLSVSGIKSSQIDQKIEIAGLGQESADALKRSVMSHMWDETDENRLETRVNEFTKAIREKRMSDVEGIPALLMYLLCLWWDEKDLGKSQCELYSNITELLLSRTINNDIQVPPIPEGDIPQCFSKTELCRKFYPVLISLGQLAFETLFKETREENTLVFNSKVAEQYLNEQSLTFCFKTGILTQTKDKRKITKQESKMSFANKTVHEYFAALYMHSTPEQITKLSNCQSVTDLLNISNVLIFLSGLNIYAPFDDLMKIINEDEITLAYRSSTDLKSDPLKQFQNICISCCEELPHENELQLCLQDVFIDDSCKQELYRKHLKQLTKRNKENIKSLHIYMRDTPYRGAREVIEYFELTDLENMEKIYYDGGYDYRDIFPLLQRSVKSLYLWCCNSSWCPLLYEKVACLENLEALGISSFKISHDQLTVLFEYISQRYCMQEIELRDLLCTDHEYSCTGCRLDLSKHSDLTTLSLDSIPLSELNISLAALEKCYLQSLSNPEFVLNFKNCAPGESKMKEFECFCIKASSAIETWLDALRLMIHVKRVRLLWINLGSRTLNLSSEMVDIESVMIWRVIMTVTAVSDIIKVVQSLPQSVTVTLSFCTITPEEDFETLKEKVRTSPESSVLKDSEGMFQFKTIKEIKYHTTNNENIKFSFRSHTS